LFVRRVGLPDDAKRELAARNFGQHCARTSWDGDFAPHRRPYSKILERSLGIFPRWCRDRIGNRKLAAADCIREREIWPNGQRKHAVGRGNENKSVAEQVLTRARLDQIALGKIIHRGNITGEEKIARHPSLDLLGERCARPISGHDPGAVLSRKESFASLSASWRAIDPNTTISRLSARAEKMSGPNKGASAVKQSIVRQAAPKTVEVTLAAVRAKRFASAVHGSRWWL